MNLGIDFGSTYSSFATYNKNLNTVDLCKPTHGESEAVPTVACFDLSGRIITGHEAREQIRDDSETVGFEAFKMLLTETDAATLEAAGYDEKYTPRFMAEKFLYQQVRKILTSYNETSVENLVICAPEVWTTKKAAERGTLDGRLVLRDICSRISEGVNVRVVSEPAAASAYFADHYRQTTGKNMKGSVLIIDYGGGTLDLTLTGLNSSDSEEKSVQIEVKNRTGVGENHPGRIGDAGISYMTEVVRLALQECEELQDEPIEADMKDSRFRKAFLALERALKAQVQGDSDNDSADDDSFRLYNVVSDCEDDISAMKSDTECFVKLRYGRRLVDVTYSHLYRAYEKVIRSNLDECLHQMTEYMDDVGIKYNDPNGEEFHIALVGGFGKFLLVQKQVRDFFDASSTGDNRFEYDLGENREFAVVMGAALLADQVLSIKHTAPYAIGVESRSRNGTVVPNFAISYREEVSEDKEFWIMKGSNPKCFKNASLAMVNLLIGYDAKGKDYNNLVIKEALASKISKAFMELQAEYEKAFPNMNSLGLAYHLGFNMNESEIVTLLIREVKTGILKRIELSSYQDMFELTEI